MLALYAHSLFIRRIPSAEVMANAAPPYLNIFHFINEGVTISDAVFKHTHSLTLLSV